MPKHHKILRVVNYISILVLSDSSWTKQIRLPLQDWIGPTHEYDDLVRKYFSPVVIEKGSHCKLRRHNTFLFR